MEYEDEQDEWEMKQCAAVTPEIRKELLALKAETERLIREADAVSVGPTDDEILIRTSKCSIAPSDMKIDSDIEW